MAGEIRAVIFDIGGILVGFRKQSFVKETRSFVPAPGGLDWRSPKVIEVHRQFELGRISRGQFYKSVLPFMREKIPFSEFARLWGGSIFVWRPRVAEYIRQLKAAGYKIGLISNCDALSYPAIMGRYGLEPFVDASAPSFKVHARKPSREIFNAALKGLGERPESCVFIDDIAEYVEIARGLGMKGIHFKSLPSLRKELAGLGVMHLRPRQKPRPLARKAKKRIVPRKRA